MCGIFGVFTNEKTNAGNRTFDDLVENLFRLSESRGKEASGIATLNNNTINVLKKPYSASQLLRDPEYKKISASYMSGQGDVVRSVIGHARLVTNGSMELTQNNQPVIKDGIVGVHNGIIVNDDTLWNQYSTLARKYTVDTEIILSLTRHFINEGTSITEAIQKVFSLMEGSAAVALFFEDSEYVLFATNNGSLYRGYSDEKNWHVVASERYILSSLYVSRKDLFGEDFVIERILPNQAYLLHRDTLSRHDFSLRDTYTGNDLEDMFTHRVRTIQADSFEKEIHTETQEQKVHYQYYQDEYTAIATKVDGLKRCTNCILPETMPYIYFDNKGICNFCRRYKKQQLKGVEALEKTIAAYRHDDEERPDSIVGLSGGRDSSYGLHYIKKELKLNPVSFSYDWGMITDEGRRNQARMSGTLGVEHIMISADIKQKRENIRKNVEAWLKKPDLGMVPLFMAGDKQYFYHAHRLKKQVGANIIILCASPYEKTDFKTGFCGVKPVFNFEKAHYELTNIGKVKLATYYLRQFIRNPRYLNRSLLDTIGAYMSYYFLPHEYVLLFDYIPWDEKEIDCTLVDEYKWQKATDTQSTWRIVDGTASFYNYIYYTVAGFTENDTFRSNQIREGVLTRDDALQLTRRDNAPRFESIKWYCDTIGVDFSYAIKTINDIPKLYDKHTH